GLDFVELVRRVAERFLPADFLPGLVDALADHRVEDAVLVVGIAVGEAALDAGVAAVGLAVLPRNHAHQLLAAHLGAEGAADAAVGAGGDDRALGQTDRIDALLLQRGSRTRLHAGAAADALGGEEVVRILPSGDHRGEATTVDGQREGPLDLVARTHAARADDAFRRVEVEVGVRLVGREAEMVRPLVAVAHVAQADVG